MSFEKKEAYFTKDSYAFLIQSFFKRGYRFGMFDELDYFLNGIVYLRHDIDFSVEWAYEMALCDYNLGIRSTFFFLPNSELYNLYSQQSIRRMADIHNMGHDICLHMDKGSYENLQNVLRCFIYYYPYARSNVIALHQPNDFSSKPKLPIGCLDVYGEQFFNNIEYASDSGGEWKYGYPLQRQAYRDKRSFQLLIHPIWWLSTADDQGKIAHELVENIRLNALQTLQQFKFMQPM